MMILFPSHPLYKRQVDPQFECEFKAAKEAGFDCYLIDTERFDKNNYEGSLWQLPQSDPVIGYQQPNAIMRGWMVKTEQYSKLEMELKKIGIQLINSAFSYKNCHYLPESFNIFAAQSPITTWIPIDNQVRLAGPDVVESQFLVEDILDAVGKVSIDFDGEEHPVFIKDYVKSVKHAWPKGCLIENPSSQSNVLQRVSEFLTLRGDKLTGGLVFRMFEEFQGLKVQSHGTVINEYRIFWYKPRKKHSVGPPLTVPLQLIQSSGNTSAPKPDPSFFQQIAERIFSNFFTMDVVQRKNGEWVVLELGDGQVAGLTGDEDAFYRSLNTATQDG
jgi:hypothetical protein